MDWDTHRFLEAFFAIPMMGAILQTVNVRLSHEQIIYTIEHAGATTLLVNDEFLGLLAEIRPRLTKVRTIVVMSDNDSFVLREEGVAGHYEDMLAAASPEFDFPDFDENTQATTFYTSGTTGAPKGVYFSHRQMVLHTISELAAFGMAPKQGRFHSESVYMPITPMFHVHAWGFPYAATAAGAKQVYPGRYVPDLLLKLIKNEGVTFTHCVPTILLMLLDAPASADTDLSGLTMVIGGAALPKMLALRAMARGIDIFTGYGMSETGPVLTLAHLKASMLSGVADEEVNFRTKTGRPIPLVDIRVVDSDMKNVAHDGKASGEIVVRAPWLTQGYYQNPDGVRGPLAWRLYAHQRHREHVAARLSADHGPHQGRDQERRRMDFVARARRHHHESPRGQRSRRHRRQGREVGRTSRWRWSSATTRPRRRRPKMRSRPMSAGLRTRASFRNTASRKPFCSSISSTARAWARSTRSSFERVTRRTSSPPRCRETSAQGRDSGRG